MHGCPGILDRSARVTSDLGGAARLPTFSHLPPSHKKFVNRLIIRPESNSEALSINSL